MTRRRDRSRTVGEAVVSVDRDADGSPRGSVIALGGRRWRTDAWPYRLRGVRPSAHGGVVVTTSDGAERLLQAQDAA